MKNLTIKLFIIALISVLFTSNAYSQEIKLKEKEKLGLRYRPSYSEDTRIAVKVNGLLAILIINQAVEFKVMRNFTVQVEGICSFYTRNF